MRKIGKYVGTVLAASVLLLGLAACEEKAGPAERAGKEVDKAVENVGRHIEKAGEKIQDAAQDAKK
jgi:predicted small secreted protein